MNPRHCFPSYLIISELVYYGCYPQARPFCHPEAPALLVILSEAKDFAFQRDRLPNSRNVSVADVFEAWEGMALLKMLREHALE